MGLLDELRAEARGVLVDPELSEVLFRHKQAWSDGTTCRFSVQDPSKTSSGSQLAQRLTGLPDVLDVRLIRVHPDDARPGTLATLPWDGGTLSLVEWSQKSDFTDQAIGIGRFTR